MRKQILILGHNYATQFVDIFNQYTYLFDKDKYEVTVGYLTGKPDEAVRNRTLAENVIFFDFPKKSLRYLKINAVKKLLALTREKKFEIVICHRYKPSYIMMIVSQFYPIPALIYVMHELGTMSAIGRQLFIAACGRKNMLYAGVSNAVRDDMRKNLWFIPKERVVTLYNMIDVEGTESQLFSREEARSLLKLKTDDIVFGNVARLAPNKDQASLIKAFSLIKPYCPQAKLILLGEGELENELKSQVAAYGLSDDIIFTGFLPVGFRYMKAFDCLVLSSIQEAFGRVLLEAMIAKLPLIASRVNGIPEVIGDSGILIEARNVDGFAQAMKQIYLLSAEEKISAGEKAYQHAIKYFSIPTFQQDFWQLPLMQALRK